MDLVRSREFPLDTQIWKKRFFLIFFHLYSQVPRIPEPFRYAVPAKDQITQEALACLFFQAVFFIRFLTQKQGMATFLVI